MATVRIDNSIFGDLPDPQMKWHDWIEHVGLQATIRLDHDILHDITYVHATFDFLIEP